MKALKKLKIISTVAIALVLVVASCKKDNELLSSSDTQNLSSESVSDSYSDEANDMSNVAIGGVTDSQYAGARTEGDSVTRLSKLDDRLKCATVSITRTGTKESPAGNIVIDFGTGCTDARGIVRKGKITVMYTGKRFTTGSTIVTTFQDYFRNGVKVEGTHTLTNLTPNNASYPLFKVVIVGGKLTVPDGRTITREHDFTREWQRALNPLQDKWVILAGSTASGTNKNGKSYTMTVDSNLVYSRACQLSNKVFIPVSGRKIFIVDGKTYTVDYGNGDCDNDITITVNGVSKTITVNADGD
jgi:hypothetical protein